MKMKRTSSSFWKKMPMCEFINNELELLLSVYIKRIQNVNYCFFSVKNTHKLINQQLKNWVKIVNWKKES